jgi:hypothetical protein
MHHAGENPLRRKEVKSAFKSLIECADLTEQRIFSDQDLQLEALNLGSERKSIHTAYELRKASKQYAPSWQISGEHYLLREKLNLSLAYSVKFSFIENHNNFYVKTLPVNSRKGSKHLICSKEVAYLRHDTQKNEIDLLEQHFKVARGKWAY